MSLNIICKSCNTVIDEVESVEGIEVPAKCPHCGMERVAVEKTVDQILGSMTFDLWLTNKITAVTMHEGILLDSKELVGKSDKEINDLFIERTIAAIANLLKSENVNMFLRRN